MLRFRAKIATAQRNDKRVTAQGIATAQRNEKKVPAQRNEKRVSAQRLQRRKEIKLSAKNCPLENDIG